MRHKNVNSPENGTACAISGREKSQPMQGNEAKRLDTLRLVLPTCAHVRFSEAELESFWRKL
jgi:hypothetical protein